MERRHKNINNEIMMEKRVLNKLSHPNIVIMYGTFQDDGSLYYFMEFLAGGELWSLTREKDEKSGLNSMVGVHWSLIRFYIAGNVMRYFLFYFFSFIYCIYKNCSGKLLLYLSNFQISDLIYCFTIFFISFFFIFIFENVEFESRHSYQIF